MKCPKCQFDNPEGSKFCGGCGQKFDLTCPECGAHNPAENKFCNECGSDLKLVKEFTDKITETIRLPVSPCKDTLGTDIPSATGERKHVTVLFSDLTGYTAMSERLDPEEVKGITSEIFNKISKIIYKYNGFIEKFAGDAVMALFGATTSHEDDPVRAIHAAREIHSLVRSLSPKYEEKIEHQLSMHTGINTGLVVTGNINLDKGIHGVAGDAINVAARLSGLAEAGEIIVASDTYYQAQGYFDFEESEPAAVKGKSEPIRIYKVLSAKDQPIKIHRLDGLRAELIGRKVEMNQLAEAVDSLKERSGSVISICGAAGTGKSRLVGDFKDSLKQQEVQWLEGHAYPYSQNIPYYPLIDLLSKALQIEEGDPPEKIREKVESGIFAILGNKTEVVPYIGSLFSLNYSEIENVSPEFWKAQLQKAVQTILSELARRAPTIICLEDLHWADPSFLELTRMLLSDFRKPILFLCIYRPAISLFSSHEINAMVNPYQEIRLQDFSPSESQQMVESLLKTQTIPSDLLSFIHDKVEGNPFYIEEMINSLIESKTLVPDSGGWKTTRSISESDISSTIHGVISGRLDRLEKESKRILQEASVIGRTFLYEILKKITQVKEQIDTHLSILERLDLVKTRTIQPDLEYIFKHALTQEAVYNGLLKKERKEIHERIGLVMEQLFKDRLPELYETLAYHFSQAKSLHKAVDYLIKSGGKSLSRYAIQESHKYYKKAYNLITDKQNKTEKERELLFDLLNKWSLVFYYRGDFKKHTELLKRHENEADLVNDKEKRGMFYGWLGFVLQFRMELADSFRYLNKALKLGEEINSEYLIGYACTWYTYSCAVTDKYEEGYSYWKRAVSIAKSIGSDPYLQFKSVAGIGHIETFSGENKHNFKIGNQLLEYGKKYSNIRGQVVGHLCIGHSYFAEGNLIKAISCYQTAIDVAEDPFYSQWPKLYLGVCSVLNNQIKEGEKALSEVLSYASKFGCEIFDLFIRPFYGIVLIDKGCMSKGLATIEEAYAVGKEKNWGYAKALSEFVLGNLYYQIAFGNKPNISIMIKNVGFLTKNIPFASKKAEKYFRKAIDSGKQYGAKGFQGMGLLGLGRLFKAKKRDEKAKECISDAIKIFEECGAKRYLEQAKEIVASLSA
ncbi:MAG: AAA family ATPase [Deltaproteobacteria bacterium]|nr:AAA family ATPase [Deltaproteobacteria bacterium]MBW2517749.1 AAA family ATPase [Deltaproteobacteria bacterium]